MIDLHCHVLHGIDDGPQDLEGSIALAQAAQAAGVTTIVATPHVSWRYENRAEDIAQRVAGLNTELRRREIGVTILMGAEVAISKAVELDDAELSALTLGGGPWLLAEPPFTPGAAGLAMMIHTLRSRGHRLVIAHPERCPAYLKDRAALEQLVSDGVLVSITAGAVAGRFGRDSRRYAMDLLQSGLVHNVASDAHSTGRRAPGMRAELEEAGYGSQADWLCEAVPAAVIAGSRLPVAPPVPQPQGGRLKRLFRA